MLPNEFFESALSEAKYISLLAEADVHQVAVSYISGRCGSTLLSEMAAKCGFGKGWEPFNEQQESWYHERYSKADIGGFFRDILHDYKQENTFYFQVTPMRARALSHVLPQGVLAAMPSSAILRRNILAQAISYHNAATTGIWHSNADVRTPVVREESEYRSVLYWLSVVVETELELLSMGLEGPIFFYEDLIAAPYETLSRFITHHAPLVSAATVARAYASTDLQGKLNRQSYVDQYARIVDRFPNAQSILDIRCGSWPWPADILKDTVAAVQIEFQKVG